MPDITYETIEANIGEVKTNGSRVDVTFKCGESGETVCDVNGTMKRDQSTGGRVEGAVKRSIWQEIKRFCYRLVGKAAGGGAGGRVARSATSEATRDMGKDAQYTENSKKEAIVEAFKTVQKQFTWNEEKKKYLAAPKE